jgi:hypothetical protein
VLTADCCKLKIVPTDVNYFFFLANREIELVPGLNKLLADKVVPQFRKYEVSAFQYILPRLYRLVRVGKSLSPNVHRCAALCHTEAACFLIVNHISTAFVRLHDLLEENQSLILNRVDILGKTFCPLENHHFDGLFKVVVKVSGFAVALQSQDKAIVQVASHFMQSVRAYLVLFDWLSHSRHLAKDKLFQKLSEVLLIFNLPQVLNLQLVHHVCLGHRISNVSKKLSLLENLQTIDVE